MLLILFTRAAFRLTAAVLSIEPMLLFEMESSVALNSLRSLIGSSVPEISIVGGVFFEITVKLFFGYIRFCY